MDENFVDTYLEKRIKDKEEMLKSVEESINSGNLSESELKASIEFRDHCLTKIEDYKSRLNRK